MSNLDSKSTQKQMQIVQQIFHNLVECVELFPQYTVAQHFSGFLRRKDPDSKEFYHWSNSELLKNIEKYKLELENESLQINTTDEDNDY